MVTIILISCSHGRKENHPKDNIPTQHEGLKISEKMIHQKIGLSDLIEIGFI